MPIDWKDQATKDRLLAAIIGSFNGVINYREVARLFGGDATYNAIENFLRGPKKLAKELKENADSDAPPSPARPRTPKKANGSPLNGVKNGRVVKTPTKSCKKGSQIKKEILDDDFTGDRDSAADADVAGIQEEYDIV
ncbi:hypothetical protein BCR34DRAFT_363727 [Clohesyomyces aquaticus]|uniref:Uncharacterized protein n=1 Tax=Clohesyomyces aquaticus TaxID=1231657 RepID=A0A1Y1ZI94_9PLEO|nr:hypothetical protein BCR34DRAFT_363727 [Clohesyomyces aquaticus]